MVWVNSAWIWPMDRRLHSWAVVCPILFKYSNSVGNLQTGTPFISEDEALVGTKRSSHSGWTSLHTWLIA